MDKSENGYVEDLGIKVHLGNRTEGYFLIGNSLCLHTKNTFNKDQLLNINNLLGWEYKDV